MAQANGSQITKMFNYDNIQYPSSQPKQVGGDLFFFFLITSLSVHLFILTDLNDRVKQVLVL